MNGFITFDISSFR